MLREQLSFELFQSEQTKVEFFKRIRAVGKPLADFPYAPLNNCSGEDKQVFRLQQRVIGELLILRDSNSPRCMSYPDFLEKLKEPSFEHHLEPLRALLENVSPDDNCRWIRLEETRKALYDLMEYCQQVVLATWYICSRIMRQKYELKGYIVKFISRRAISKTALKACVGIQR